MPCFKIVLVPLLLLAVYLYPYIPGHHLVPCAIKYGTGIDCPGCGMTRSISALLHGDLKQSLELHPLGWMALIWLLLIWIKGISGKDLYLRAWSYLMVASLLTTWIIKLLWSQKIL